ncbi:hypothetical protein F5887DRAFT_893721 [Amanita rubescens]|nr:hypothetical protein F5887DRAFT_893721 [Amanita rubescens]
MAGPSHTTRASRSVKAKKGQPQPPSTSDSSPTLSLTELQELNQQSRKTYGKAARTVAAYDSYITKGKEFLALTVKARREKGESQEKDEIDTNLLEKAFEKPPNGLSATALELFLVHKCLGLDGCGPSTAERIHAAFCDYWDNMDGEEYAGGYQYDKARNTVRGCPARARDVKALLKRIKNKNGMEGGKALRNHARAIRIEDLTRMMDWSEKIVPSTSLEKLDKKDITFEVIKHTLMRAFLSSAFTLWTRNSELCSIQTADLEMGCVGPPPHFFPYFRVRLLHRKGWQKQMDSYDGPLQDLDQSSITGQIYEIYKQDVSAADMYTHLQRWKWFLEEKLLSRKLTDSQNEFIFPTFGSNGVIYPNQELSYDTVQEYIDEFQAKAGLSGRFTTHSFRRGRAQYRFMCAPLGQRWALNRIRWWGGWAKKEGIDTLIRYLVDSVQNEENTHSNALCPIQSEADGSLAGEHKLARPVTTEEFRTGLHALHMTIKQDITESISSSISSIVAAAPSFCNGLPVPAVPAALPVYLDHHQLDHLTPTHPLANSSNMPSVLRQILPRFSTILDQRQNVSQPCTIGGGTKRQEHRVVPPIPDLRIDDLGKGPDAWMQAVHQWDVAASRGIAPLKSWKPDWYQGAMASYFAAKRSQRKTIAEEYARYNSDKDAFLQDYPMAGNVKDLLNAIRKRHHRRRTSCNGTPEERDSQVDAAGQPGPVRTTRRASCRNPAPY